MTKEPSGRVEKSVACAFFGPETEPVKTTQEQVPEERNHKLSISSTKGPGTHIVANLGLDIILGRNRQPKEGDAKSRLYQIIKSCKPFYMGVPEVLKNKISRNIVDTVHEWGGRFLKDDLDHSGLLLEVADSIAQVKVGQMLREDNREPSTHQTRVGNSSKRGKASTEPASLRQACRIHETKINHLDVLFDSNGTIKAHHGAFRLLRLVKSCKSLHRNSSSQSQEDISRNLQETVKEWGGRFLEMGPRDSAFWVELTNPKARKKISKIFYALETAAV